VTTSSGTSTRTQVRLTGGLLVRLDTPAEAPPSAQNRHFRPPSADPAKSVPAFNKADIARQ
jgi:hypothetical protein